MSMFTLAISYLTTSNLPWFMDLTLKVPMQYCSFQHRTSLPSPVTSTTGRCFCFSSISSFFLELFLHSSPVAYWAPTDLGSSSFNVLSFCLFILFMGFSRQEHWSGLPFPSPVGKGVHQGYTLLPCLFNLYVEHIMRNAGLDEAQAGIKIVRRNANNLRYTMTPPLWQKVKKN